MRRLSDVIELIRVNQLPIDFADKLAPYDAPTFEAMWRAAQVDEDY